MVIERMCKLHRDGNHSLFLSYERYILSFYTDIQPSNSHLNLSNITISFSIALG